MRTTSDRAPSAGTYGAGGLAVTLAGCVVAARAGVPPLEVGVGALGAWAVQTTAFWPLWRTIRRRERALRVWVAGIAARVAGLGLVAGGAALAGLRVEPAAVAYALTVVVLLLAEGWWLARSSAGGPPDASAGSGPDDGEIREDREPRRPANGR